jgi:hypothetical protein
LFATSWTGKAGFTLRLVTLAAGFAACVAGVFGLVFAAWGAALETIGFADPLLTGLATDFASFLATGWAATFTALADAAREGFFTLAGLAVAPVFTACRVAGLAAGFTAVFVALATGRLTDLAAALTAAFAVPGTLVFFTGLLAFTSCLLAERLCAWSGGTRAPGLAIASRFGDLSTAGECTGLAIGKPMSCKRETNTSTTCKNYLIS